VRYTLHN